MILELIGLLALWFGVAFSVIGVIGLLRFPDVYTRIHAAAKVATLGLFGVLLAVALLLPGAALKMVVLFIFLLLTMPVASHSIASAAHNRRMKVEGAVRDDLAAFKDQHAEQVGMPSAPSETGGATP